jgi:hypothetical protein
MVNKLFQVLGKMYTEGKKYKRPLGRMAVTRERISSGLDYKLQLMDGDVEPFYLGNEIMAFARRNRLNPIQANIAHWYFEEDFMEANGNYNKYYNAAMDKGLERSFTELKKAMKFVVQARSNILFASSVCSKHQGFGPFSYSELLADINFVIEDLRLAWECPRQYERLSPLNYKLMRSVRSEDYKTAIRLKKRIESILNNDSPI